MTSPLESDLRALVRELIRDVLPEVREQPEVREVRITNDADLAGFVAAILDLAQDGAEVERIRSGGLRFAWNGPSSSQPVASQADDGAAAAKPEGSTAPQPILRIDKGAVTERMVGRALADGTRIMLGKGAVVTPLAREYARKNKVTLERAS